TARRQIVSNRRRQSPIENRSQHCRRPPSRALESIPKPCGAELTFRIILGVEHQHADAAHAVALLPPRRERPRDRAAEQRDELAPPHSITSVAMASNPSGTLSPSALAVFRLIANSNLVGCSTGSSAGLAPCRIRCTYQAPRLNRTGRGVP